MNLKTEEIAMHILTFAENYDTLDPIKKCRFHQLLFKANKTVLEVVLANIPYRQYEEFRRCIWNQYVNLKLEEENSHNKSKYYHVMCYELVYDNLPLGEKRKLEKYLESCDVSTLGYILEKMDHENYSSFHHFIEDIYISKLAANGKQRKFLKESLQNTRENYERKRKGELVDLDTYNYGKHCDKFSRRRSGKKWKGKCYANIRKEEVGF